MSVNDDDDDPNVSLNQQLLGIEDPAQLHDLRERKRAGFTYNLINLTLKRLS